MSVHWGYDLMRSTCGSSIALYTTSETPFWATVKSALPVWRTETAVRRRLWVSTPSATTVMMPIATATPVSDERSLRVKTLRAISAKNDIRG